MPVPQPPLTQGAMWPGIAGVSSFHGTISHGIQPASFILTTAPQLAPNPEPFGDLVLTDGTNQVTLQDCRLGMVNGSIGPEGQTLTFEILDRRWRWAEFGAVDGQYNTRESGSGKYIPWTLRSPVELATLLLDALGEVDYEIDLPKGLSKADGANLDRYLRAGENLPQTLANPPQIWDRSRPHEVLARLCEFFGRRLVFQPIANRVVIARLGDGDDLPDGPSEVIAPSVKIPAMPQSVGVAGDVRMQYRWLLEAVGLEWTMLYVPINELSYAPQNPAAKQVTEFSFIGFGAPSSLEITFTWIPLTGGPQQTVVVRSTDTGITTIAARWAAIIAAINASAVSKILTATSAFADLALTGLKDGQQFAIEWTQPLGGIQVYKRTIISEARLGGASWATADTPNFNCVLATERLSKIEAMGLAQRSVFKCYRIRLADPFTGKAPFKFPFTIPDANLTVRRRQQIVLSPTKVEQVVPSPRIEGGVNNQAPIGSQGIVDLASAYGGYSRDQPAMVRGSIARFVQSSVVWNVNQNDGGTASNTPDNSRVFVPFEVDQREQMITFSDHVFLSDYAGGGFKAEPQLTLETACRLLDVDTNQIIRWKWELPLGGDAPTQWSIHEDAQVGAIGLFSENSNQGAGVKYQDQDDADQRASYYLQGMALPYELTAGLVRQYAGIWLIDPDGKIQQVTWSGGEAGPTTIASTNTEHAWAVPNYPERRRAEMLPPNQAAAAANLVERAATIAKMPDPSK